MRRFPEIQGKKIWAKNEVFSSYALKSSCFQRRKRDLLYGDIHPRNRGQVDIG